MPSELKKALATAAKRSHLPTSTLGRLAILRYLDRADPLPVQPLDETVQTLDTPPRPAP
jgi:hypothetical protein